MESRIKQIVLAALGRMAIVTALTATLSPLPGRAGPVTLDDLAAHAGEAETCWRVAYDDAHLAAHRDQTVTALMLVLGFEIFGQEPEMRQYGFGIEVLSRSRSQSGGSAGNCQDTDQGVRCVLRCDGGGFLLRPGRNKNEIVLELASEDSLRLQSGWEDCDVDSGEHDRFVPGREDRVFRLARQHLLVCARGLSR